jgi:hypothetical protein
VTSLAATIHNLPLAYSLPFFSLNDELKQPLKSLKAKSQPSNKTSSQDGEGQLQRCLEVRIPSITIPFLLTWRSFERPVVVVRVGTGEKQIDCLIQEEIIRRSQLCNEALGENVQRIIILPDVAVASFSIYYQWLRTGKLHTKTVFAHKELEILARACILGHFLDDTDFIDSIHNAVLQYCTEDGHESFVT